MKNVFYFKHLNTIGGIEQFFAYLTEKYCDWDITIVYRTGDPLQIARLRRFARVIKFAEEPIVCDKAFFCFNSDIIDYVECKEKALILHGDYKAMVEQGQLPKDCYIFNSGFDEYYGVSQIVCDSWTELTGKPCKLVYNPFIKSEPKRVLKLVYCGRLTQEKGGDLANKLIKRLDQRGIDYKFYVYSNQEDITGNNVEYLGTRLDAGQFLNKYNYDYIVVPSKNEGYCYSLVQALSNGLPAVITPCPVFKELGVNSTNSIQLDFGGTNIDTVIDKMLEYNLSFTYTAPEDNWDKILKPGKTTYQYMCTDICATKDYFDTELNITVKQGDVCNVSKDRADYIVSLGYAVFI